MKKIYCLIVILFWGTFSFAQDTTSVEVFPRFPGGETALNDWLIMNTIYPESARKNGINGTVIIQFIVDKNGVIKNAKVVRKVHPLLDDAAMNTILKMPNWEPGTKDGIPVAVLINLPFNFGIGKNSSKKKRN